MWSWLEPIGSAGSWVLAVCLALSIVCSLYAYVLATLALRHRQPVHLRHRFLWGVEIEIGSKETSNAQHERVAEVKVPVGANRPRSSRRSS